MQPMFVENNGAMAASLQAIQTVPNDITYHNNKTLWQQTMPQILDFGIENQIGYKFLEF